MGSLSHQEVETASKQPHRGTGETPRSVSPCNFRSAGRLSNEMARSLTAIHEAFARHLTAGLTSYLGNDIAVKLLSLDQLPIKDHVATIPPLDYIVPFTAKAIQSNVIVECDIELVFPMIDLLLGGAGAPTTEFRDLSELEEEIMQELASLIGHQVESAWRMPHQSLAANSRVKASSLDVYCPPTEKVTVAKFEMQIATFTGVLQVVYPTTFVNLQSKQFESDKPQAKGRVRRFPSLSIRERILDCDVVVAAGLATMKVPVRDLIGLQPGCVLKLRAPVKAPGLLTVGGLEIFEATPVRNGTYKAAQLGRRLQSTSWGKE
jgi:flagellar motor switch protein FliM